MVSLTNILACKHIHFVGIGGVSTSALATYLVGCGVVVTGSDACQSNYTKKLQQLGIKIAIGDGTKLMYGCNLVVTNSAISKDNKEVLFAFKNNIPTIGREVLLGFIFDNFANNIAICGMHGKTTTCAMVSYCLYFAKKQPTVFIGGDAKSFGGNFARGKGDFCVAEACEYKANFLHMHPLVNCILNVDFDHADFYKSLDEVKQTFVQFASQTKQNGLNVINGDDVNLSGVDGITFGLKNGNFYQAKNLVQNRGVYTFDVYKQNKFCATVSLSVCGKHNVYNALCTFAVLDFFGISHDTISQGLNCFDGVDRRCCVYKGCVCDVVVDYAHHPNEITSFLQTISQMGYKKTYLVFQPHTYSRTKGLFSDFANCLVADDVYILPTYAAREKVLVGYESHDLVAKINRQNVFYAPDVNLLVQTLKNRCKQKDVILLVGAGDVNNLLQYLK